MTIYIHVYMYAVIHEDMCKPHSSKTTVTIFRFTHNYAIVIQSAKNSSATNSMMTSLTMLITSMTINTYIDIYVHIYIYMYIQIDIRYTLCWVSTSFLSNTPRNSFYIPPSGARHIYCEPAPSRP